MQLEIAPDKDSLYWLQEIKNANWWDFVKIRGSWIYYTNFNRSSHSILSSVERLCSHILIAAGSASFPPSSSPPASYSHMAANL